jgi:S1-C subfamily serine protease
MPAVVRTTFSSAAASDPVEVKEVMGRWKIAGAAALVVGAVAALFVFAPGLQGQDRPSEGSRHDEVARIAAWFGGQIGVTVRDGEAPAGVVVERVRQDSPAEKAGVKEGDVIVEFDGERVRSSRQFSRLVEETAQGRAAKMIVERSGQRVTLDVTPEARQFGHVTPVPLDRFRMEMPRFRNFDPEIAVPDIEIYSSRQGRLGVLLEDLADQLAEYFGVKRGALVTSVSKDSAAARAGFKAGDVITKIGDEAVEDTRDVRREIRRMDSDKEFAVEVVREKKPLTLKVRLGPPSTSSRRPGTSTERF